MLVDIFEAVSELFKDESKVFTEGLYSWRIRIKPIKLGGVEFKPLFPKLSFVRNKDAWAGYPMGWTYERLFKEDYSS